MIYDLPCVVLSPPNGRAPREPLPLHESVGNEENVRANLPAMKILNLPRLSDGRCIALLQRVQNELPTIAPPRSAGFPKVRCSHSLKIRAGHSEFRPMEDRLSPQQFLRHSLIFRSDSELWSRVVPHSEICWQRAVYNCDSITLHFFVNPRALNHSSNRSGQYVTGSSVLRRPYPCPPVGYICSSKGTFTFCNSDA